ncbi:malate dehydrogenase, partial [Quercus suber]
SVQSFGSVFTLSAFNFSSEGLHLFDVVNSPGVTADITHMDTGAVGPGSPLPLEPRPDLLVGKAVAQPGRGVGA